ncbi:hypothetical protein TrRE_jg6801 [Triparma retinervis]|uniref:Cyclic nucleotide-binding domain-containing protein n=1 Tax=Triparma retinervis TaxID=2557542 RepID=A0A9W7CCX6_9STRA|nr:hypothetical protein TrRE_jg6801 [Triparma retinervis]
MFLSGGRKNLGIKILHDELYEAEQLQAVSERRASLQQEGLTQEEIEKAMAKADADAKGKFLIHPDSRYRLWWDMITAFYVVYLIWLVPFSIGFEQWYPNSGMKSFNVLIDIWFIFDVILNFRTGYVDHGVMVMDQKKIMKKYLQTYFLVDFVASVPWELFLGNFESADRKTLKLVKYFKVPKLMRISRMIRFFSKYTRFYGLTLSMMSMLVLVHAQGCITAGVIADVCFENDYIFQYDNGTYYKDDTIEMCESASHEKEGGCTPHLCATGKVFELYSESLFLSMSYMIGAPVNGYVGGDLSDMGCHAIYARAVNTSRPMPMWSQANGFFYQDDDEGSISIVNEDDIVCPSNLVKLVSKYDDDNWHFIFVTLFLLIGIAQVAILYGHLGLLLQSKYQASAAFRMKLDRVKTECKYYKVPWDLQNRVYAYYDYLWVNQKQYDDKIMLMNDRGMSSDLRGKLALFLYKDVIQGVTLFERVDDTFLSKICMELQTRIYLPEDWVITKGDIGSELYIISRGVVQVFIVDANELIEQGVDEETARKKAEDGSIFLHRGNFFGEVSLLMETRRTTGVQAKTVCELNVLVQEVFEEILRESPEFAEEMKNLVLERKLHNAKTGASNKTKKNVGEGNASVLHSVSFGHTVENIEAAVVDAIESRQLVTNMRHAANFDDEDIEHAPEITATSDLDEIVSQRSHRNSFIKPIQDQIDKEKKERSAGRRASMDAVAEESKEESSADENPDNGNLEGIAGELRAEILEEHQNRQQAQSAPGQPPGSGSPHRGSFSQGRRGSRRALGFTRGMSGRRDSMRSEASVDMENRANQLSEQARVMQDVISMQVATLQERTDKVYAMLTTKLGRVR